MNLLKMENTPIYLIAVGGLMAIFGAFWLNYNANKSNEKLRIQSENVINILTGGDSFIYLNIGIRTSNGLVNDSSGIFTLARHGNNIIPSAKISLYRVTRDSTSREMAPISEESFSSIGPSFFWPTFVGRYELPSQKRLAEYVVKIVLPNGNYSQHIILKKDDANRWFYGSSIFKYHEYGNGSFQNKLIHQDIDQGWMKSQELRWNQF